MPKLVKVSNLRPTQCNEKSIISSVWLSFPNDKIKKKMNGDKESQLARMILPTSSCETIYHHAQSTLLLYMKDFENENLWAGKNYSESFINVTLDANALSR